MARRKHAPEQTVDEVLVNLNARVPRNLWRRVRLQCTREGQLLRTFITQALEERLRVERRRSRD
jgi:predicted HicB family RNase H-like nuclease